jgi:nucleoside-diphosphate-sugar epimerase
MSRNDGIITIGGVTLVLGGTGATGRHVVYQLLQLNRPVHVIVRSKERMISALHDIDFINDKSNRFSLTDDAATIFPLLSITEASVVDLTDTQIKDICNNVDNVVCCLGHTMTFKGMYGKPRRFVSDTVKRFANTLASTPGATKRKFIVMTSDGVPHPSDDPYRYWVRLTMGCIRRCVPPHADNEAVGDYFLNLIGAGNMEWIMIRPTNLVNGPVTKYNLYDKPVGLLFGKQVVSRSNVAKFIVDLISDETLFTKYKFRMPVVHSDTEQSQILSKKKSKHS